jgi:hypothetical protein
MRMSCNGCRVLRKGCTEGCTIRPSLEWIESPEAQANATVFLAKFYGRAGLLNLLAAGPGPALFRSLLYEACGRMANPVYGSVGLLCSGQWEACQAAVEAVLKGHRIVQLSTSNDAGQATPPLSAYDIRHVAKDPADAAADPLRVSRAGPGRTRFKRTTAKSKSSSGAKRTSRGQEPERVENDDDLDHRAPSREETAGSHGMGSAVEQTREEESAGSHVSQAEEIPVPPVRQDEEAHDDEIGLGLTLGFEQVRRVARSPSARIHASSSSAESSHVVLRLELPA